jgi:hypothetical protein
MLERDPQSELQALLAQYSALREEIAGFVNGFINLGSLIIVGTAAAITLSFQLDLTPLRIILPATIIILTIWGTSHFYGLFYEAAFVSILERRINRILGVDALDWDSVWATPRANPLVFRFLYSLISVWLVAIIAYALVNGITTIYTLMNEWEIHTYGSYFLLSMYVLFHVCLVICAFVLQFIWLPKSIRGKLETWKRFYALE